MSPGLLHLIFSTGGRQGEREARRVVHEAFWTLICSLGRSPGPPLFVSPAPWKALFPACFWTQAECWILIEDTEHQLNSQQPTL